MPPVYPTRPRSECRSARIAIHGPYLPLDHGHRRTYVSHVTRRGARTTLYGRTPPLHLLYIDERTLWRSPCLWGSPALLPAISTDSKTSIRREIWRGWSGIPLPRERPPSCGWSGGVEGVRSGCCILTTVSGTIIGTLFARGDTTPVLDIPPLQPRRGLGWSG